MLDDQVLHNAMLGKQGTMTQMEKGFNRTDLKGFKLEQVQPAAMIPGLQNESPLRNVVGYRRKNGNRIMNKIRAIQDKQLLELRGTSQRSADLSHELLHPVRQSIPKIRTSLQTSPVNAFYPKVDQIAESKMAPLSVMNRANPASGSRRINSKRVN